MFDIGFAELVIIGVVGLIVIGPERLPDAIRTGSAWLNRFRRSFNEIKREVQQELHNDAVMRDLKDSGDSLRRETEALRRELSGDVSDLASSVADITGPPDVSAGPGTPAAPGDTGDTGDTGDESDRKRDD